MTSITCFDSSNLTFICPLRNYTTLLLSRVFNKVLKELRNSSLVNLVNFANYAPSIAIELKVSKEITYK